MRGFDHEVFLHLRISLLQQAYSRMHCPSHTQSGVHGRPAFTHLHLLLQLFLQSQWTSSLQLTAAAGMVVHLGCICPYRESSPNLWGQEGQVLELLPVPTRILLDKWPASHAVSERHEWVEVLLILFLSS